jgi:L-ascorbate metabolism protein UlaG (beta-lactamase superfamily)
MVRSPRINGVRRATVCAFALFLGSCGITPTLPNASEFKAERNEALQLRYFGTTTLTISDGKNAVMIDGFFSRPGLGRLGLASTGLKLMQPNERRITEGLKHLEGQKIDAIFVAHAHHDHAMDTAHVAKAKGAKVFGSESVLNVVNGQDLNVLASKTKDGTTHCVGDFKITVIDSPHESTLFGPGGDIETPLRTPASLRAYRAGPSFAFHIAHPKGNVLVVPSVDVRAKPEVFKNYPADVVLLGVGLLGRESPADIAAYWNAVVRATRAKEVHPIHWDNFMHPLDEPMKSFWYDKFRRSRKELCNLAKDREKSTSHGEVSISLLPLYVPVPIPSTHAHASGSRFCPLDASVRHQGNDASIATL